LAITIGILIRNATEKQPWIPLEDILADGAKALKISEDRPLLEYFDLGDPHGSLILAIHGHSTTGRFFLKSIMTSL